MKRKRRSDESDDDDEYDEEPDGYLRAKSEKFADQLMVFSKVGESILDNEIKG